MQRRERRVVEQPHGVGELKEEGEIIAAVRYSLRVTRDVIITENFDGCGEIDGMGQIDGSIPFIEKNKEINSEEIYTLSLIDGREIDISIPLSDVPYKEYKFIVKRRG